VRVPRQSFRWESMLRQVRRLLLLFVDVKVRLSGMSVYVHSLSMERLFGIEIIGLMWEVKGLEWGLDVTGTYNWQETRINGQKYE
jgi:hypothetical protein